MPIDTYSDKSGATNCTPCTAGKYSKSGSSLCCPVNFAPNSGKCVINTTKCAPNKFLNGNSIQACQLGKYSPGDTTMCCKRNYFLDSISGNCTACEVGTYSPGGTSKCCPVNYFLDTAKNVCIECERNELGTIKLFSSGATSKCCPVDSTLSASGDCKTCTKNSYSPYGTNTVCCPENYFYDTTRTPQCTKCPASTFTTGGRLKCCNSITVYNVFTNQCDDCPNGKIAQYQTNSCVTQRQGY